jgi:GNAT superfamily N-acetyltransferase
MQIAYLADHPEHIPTVAAWHYAEWGHLNSGDSVPSRIERLHQHSGRPGIPTTLIALEEGTLLGAASLVVNDLRTHPHLTPFLASVYVAPEYRRRGAASALVRQAMAVVQQLGIPTFYLITPDQQRLYAGLGWNAQGEVEYRGEWVTLMSVTLTTATTVR